jgi:hypothetical protein
VHSADRHVTLPLLQLRLRLLTRGAKALFRTEPLALAGIVAMLAFAQWRLFAVTRDGAGRWFVVACSIAVVLSLHIARGDETLLRIAGARPRRLFVAEYIMLCVPFSIPLLFSAAPQLAVVGLGCALCISMLPAGRAPQLIMQRAQRRAPWPVPLPVTTFEWIAGVRRSAPWLAILHVVAALLSHRFELLIVFVVLIVLTPVGFYQHGESRTLVDVFARTPDEFLRDKIWRATTLLCGLATPVAVLTVLRHAAYWYVPIAVLLLGIFVLTVTILVKYTFYREGGRGGVTNSLVIGAVSASVAIPPVAIFLLYRLWKQSVQNLAPSLRAFDR